MLKKRKKNSFIRNLALGEISMILFATFSFAYLTSNISLASAGLLCIDPATGKTIPCWEYVQKYPRSNPEPLSSPLPPQDPPPIPTLPLGINFSFNAKGLKPEGKSKSSSILGTKTPGVSSYLYAEGFTGEATIV